MCSSESFVQVETGTTDDHFQAEFDKFPDLILRGIRLEGRVIDHPGQGWRQIARRKGIPVCAGGD